MQIEEIKLGLVDKIMSIENKSLLEKLGKLFNIEKKQESLSAAQIEMLQMAKSDIENGRYLEDDSLTAKV